MQSIIKHNLLRAQHRMKMQADKHRQERKFEVGDWVYLKLQPFAQSSVARRVNNKLSYKFSSPYLITNKVGPVAYKLQLPQHSQIHPVIHLSQLKKALPPETLVRYDDALHCLHITHPIMPVQVSEQKLQKLGNKLVPFGWVQWENLPATWTTWENLRIVHSSSSKV